MFEKLLPHRQQQQGGLKRRQEESHPLARFRRDFDELWDRFLEEGATGLGFPGDQSLIGGQVEWDDQENEYLVRAELPGFEPDEIDVKLAGNVLTMTAEHREEQKEGDNGYRRYGRFYESFTLPQNVREEEIDARYHNGVLELRLPKSESSQAKRISVKAE
ncbi:Hsp20/alpha crystallin family protein [Candidatus Laterigemmans baculatus]|uniref:Hsp20/alpha crystallin family protein n=1 Tax=Candidatus Laterigemmans baculatus TaxID=2770505 RepID=UPI0013DD3718|nr:Hsp20/alpha crystallin family protein [Candidatus Laterigemmans baculatus]